MNVFYTTDISGKDAILDPVESIHCIKVLRFRKGDPVRLVDGTGGYYEGVIENESPRECRITVVSSRMQYQPLPYFLHLAIAPTKNMDRFEWFIEKATEIGISAITPLYCMRSERRNLRLDRLEKVIISAVKQSVKAYKPSLLEPMEFTDFINTPRSGSRFIAHCMEGSKKRLIQAGLAETNILLIGPEGDFTSEEVHQAEVSGYVAVTLGNYRLRTETAGVVACASVYQALA